MIKRSISCDLCPTTVDTKDSDRVPAGWGQINVWVANKKGEATREETFHACPACLSVQLTALKGRLTPA